MISFRTPKGWMGPQVVDGLPVEGTWRAHQVPLAELATKPEHLGQLEEWLRSYKPDELCDANGCLMPKLQELAPEGRRRMGANPHANGGMLLQDLKLPDFRAYAVAVAHPGTVMAEATRIMGGLLRDVMTLNSAHRTFRVVGPNETASNRLTALFDVTDRVSTAAILKTDEHISPDGRVMEVLSEHLCQGWLEGYFLTGRHGLFSCYETRCGRVAANARAGAEGSSCQRRGPDDAPAANGASAWAERRGVRRAVHARQTHRVRVSRLSVVDPSIDVSSHQPREPACARIQGTGHDNHAIRHDRIECSRSVSSRGDAIDRVPGLASRATSARQVLRDKLTEHHRYIRQYGQDMPEIRNWVWHAR